MPAHSSNPKGFWEVEALTHLNDQILATLEGSWRRPPTGLEPAGWQDNRLASIRRQAQKLLADTFRDGDWVWKDPRTSLTLPFWLHEIGIQPVILYVYRNPLEVWKSLAAQEKVSRQEAMALWEIYVRSALENMNGLPVFIVRHRLLLDDPVGTLERVACFLRAYMPAVKTPNRDQIAELVDASLNHWRYEAPSSDDETTSPQERLFIRLEGLAECHERFPEVSFGSEQQSRAFEELV